MYKGVVKLVDIKAAFTGCVGELQCTSLAQSDREPTSKVVGLNPAGTTK